MLFLITSPYHNNFTSTFVKLKIRKTLLVKFDFYLKYCLDKDQEAMLVKNEKSYQVTIICL